MTSSCCPGARKLCEPHGCADRYGEVAVGQRKGASNEGDHTSEKVCWYVYGIHNRLTIGNAMCGDFRKAARNFFT